ENEFQHIFTGTLLIGLGIHFRGLEQYDFWLDHWSVFSLMVGLALLMRLFKTKRGRVLTCILFWTPLIMICSSSRPGWFDWRYDVAYSLETLWPLAQVVRRLYYLRFKK